MPRKIKRRGKKSGKPKGQVELLQQLQDVQESVLRAQEEATDIVTTATAGGGAVSATVTGEPRVQAITIEPDVVDPQDVEMLQDLVTAAVNEALEQVEREKSEHMASIAGDLNLPDLGLPGLP